MNRNALSSPNILTLPKTIELEQRVARNELAVTDLRAAIAAKDAQIASLKDTIGALYRRVASLQAQIDHLSARSGRY
jgi:uncharacterized coiled-coil protein SlyX